MDDRESIWWKCFSKTTPLEPIWSRKRTWYLWKQDDTSTPSTTYLFGIDGSVRFSEKKPFISSVMFVATESWVTVEDELIGRQTHHPVFPTLLVEPPSIAASFWPTIFFSRFVFQEHSKHAQWASTQNPWFGGFPSTNEHNHLYDKKLHSLGR